MDLESLRYLEAEDRAARDFEKHERDVMTEKSTPPPPYIDPKDRRPHRSTTVDLMYPGAYAIALTHRGGDERFQRKVEAKLRLHLMVLFAERGVPVVPGQIPDLADDLIASARAEGFQR